MSASDTGKTGTKPVVLVTAAPSAGNAPLTVDLDASGT